MGSCSLGDKKEGFIFKDFLLPEQGFVISPVGYFRDVRKAKNKRYITKIVSVIERKSAKGLIKVIEKSKQNYPFKQKYHFIGPNSNTYVQWIINQFNDLDIELPWNAIGKNYLN